MKVRRGRAGIEPQVCVIPTGVGAKVWSDLQRRLPFHGKLFAFSCLFPNLLVCFPQHHWKNYVDSGPKRVKATGIRESRINIFLTHEILAKLRQQICTFTFTAVWFYKQVKCEYRENNYFLSSSLKGLDSEPFTILVWKSETSWGHRGRLPRT